MSFDPVSLRALLRWWEDAGVESAEVEAILATPLPESAPTRAEEAKAAPARRLPPRPVEAAPEEAAARDARKAAAAANTLEELHAAIAAFDGVALRKTAKNTVFADGVEGAPVMLIGEAPGKDEDASGKPCVGRSGQLMDRMFQSIGFSRTTNLFISNVIFWRPPGNRPPTQVEIAACLPFVERAIELAKPKLLVSIGGFAAQALLKRDDGVLRLRGKRLTASLPGVNTPLHAMVMLHPAYLLRRPQDKRLAWQDLLALSAWADELGISRDPGR